MVALGGASLSLWGVGAASPLRQNALDFLLIKALGAPATLLLMVAQVLLLSPCLACLLSGRTPYRGNCLAAEAQHWKSETWSKLRLALTALAVSDWWGRAEDAVAYRNILTAECAACRECTGGWETPEHPCGAPSPAMPSM